MSGIYILFSPIMFIVMRFGPKWRRENALKLKEEVLYSPTSKRDYQRVGRENVTFATEVRLRYTGYIGHVLGKVILKIKLDWGISTITTTLAKLELGLVVCRQFRSSNHQFNLALD